MKHMKHYMMMKKEKKYNIKVFQNLFLEDYELLKSIIFINQFK